MVGAAILLWGYGGEIYNWGWYDREAKIEQHTGKPAPKLKPKYKPRGSIPAPPDQKKPCIPRPDPWPDRC